MRAMAHEPLHVQVHPQAAGELPLAPAALEALARAVLRAERVDEAELSFALVGDAEIERLNREFLGHDGPTDILSFPLQLPGQPPLGDVYIGVEQARRQAEALGVGWAEELQRLVVHGTLHVLGYTHPEGEGREASEMYRRQEQLLAEWLRRGAT